MAEPDPDQTNRRKNPMRVPVAQQGGLSAIFGKFWRGQKKFKQP